VSAAPQEVSVAAARPESDPRSARLYGSLGIALVLWVALYLVIQPAANLLTHRVLGLGLAYTAAHPTSETHGPDPA